MTMTKYLYRLAMLGCLSAVMPTVPSVGQTADFSVKFSDFSLGATSIYFSEYSAFADETWYFGRCTNQYGMADSILKVTDYSAFADITIHPTEYATFADRRVCIIGEAPEQLLEALR